MAAATRAQQLDHVSRMLELSDEVSTYLVEVYGIRSAARLANMTDSDLTSAMSGDESPMTEADRKEIVKFRWWYRTWSRDSQDTLLLVDVMTEEMWDRIVYDPSIMDEVQPTATPGEGDELEGAVDGGSGTLFRVRADLRQFKKFNGRMEEYTAWKRGFIATITAQGLGDLVDPMYVPPGPEDPGRNRYLQKNHYLHATLVVVTADGTCIIIVEQHKAEQDGVAAWKNIIDWYEGQGNAENIAMRAIKGIQECILTRTTRDGGDGYLSVISKYHQDLEENGHRFDEIIKKVMILGNIRDDRYAVLVEMLRGDTTKTYEDCVMEIRRKAVELRSNEPALRQARQAVRNNTARRNFNVQSLNRGPVGNQAALPDDWVDDAAWAALSPQQRTDIRHRRGMRARRGGGNRNNNNIPNQYGRRQQVNLARQVPLDQQNRVQTGRVQDAAAARVLSIFGERAERDRGQRQVNNVYLAQASPAISAAFREAPWIAQEQADPVMIVDGGAEITVIGDGWRIVHFTGDFVSLTGYNNREAACRAPIVSALTFAKYADGRFRITGVHEAAYLTESCKTSLLSANQARSANGVKAVDDVAKCYGGTQRIVVNVGHDGFRVEEDHIPLEQHGNLLGFNVSFDLPNAIISGMTPAEVEVFIPDRKVNWLTSALPNHLDEEALAETGLNDERWEAYMARVQEMHEPGHALASEVVAQQPIIDDNTRFRPDERNPDQWVELLTAREDRAMVRDEERWLLGQDRIEQEANFRPIMPAPDEDMAMGLARMVSDGDDESIDASVIWDVENGDGTTFNTMERNDVVEGMIELGEQIVIPNTDVVGGIRDLVREDEMDTDENSTSSIGYYRTLSSLVNLATVMAVNKSSEEGEETPLQGSDESDTPSEGSIKNKPAMKDEGIRPNVRRNVDYKAVQSKLGWLPMEVIKNTYANTTQLAKRTRDRLPLRRHYKSRYPELNRKRLRETFATDTFFSSEKAISGYLCMQLFVGLKSRFTATYGMQTESQGHQALEDFIREHGAPYVIRSDNAKMEIGHAFTQICRKYNIKQETTEPHHPQQNPAERQIQEVKKRANMIMDRTGCPENVWYLAVQYVVYLLNRTANEALKWKTPLEVAFGDTPDISNLLQFEFWELVYYHDPQASFPDSKECLGRFVGIAENVGDFMTYYVLAENSEVLARSSVRSAAGSDPNRRLIDRNRNEGSNNNRKPRNFVENDDKEDGEPTNENVRSLNDIANIDAPEISDPEDIIGFKFVGEFKGLPTSKTVRSYDPVNEEFSLELGNGLDETVEYGTIIELFNKKEEEKDTDVWTYEEFTGHRKVGRGPWEVEVLWTTGEKTWEKVGAMRKDDPLTLARYARDNNLLGQEGWKWAEAYRANPTRMIRIVHRILAAAKNRKKRGPKYKFGVRVPRTVAEAFGLDQANGNSLWAEAIQKEMNQLDEFKTFRVLEPGDRAPEGFTFVPLHWCFDVKFDGRRKGRLVAGGNWTEPLDTDAYSGVVSIDTIRLAFLLAQVNGLTAIATDISNAYLHGLTKEKVYTKAGPEFGKHAGRTLVIEKATYGLRGSSYAWHEVLADYLRSLGWRPSYADSDLWIMDCGTHYEYLATWVDDVLHWSKDPMKLIKQLEDRFSLKGTGMPEYYLGGDIDQVQWKDGCDGRTVALSARTYITQVCERVEKMFEVELRHYASPMDPLYHPEIDQTSLLTPLMIPKYQMLVGCANWVVTLGRFDVYYAVSTMARYNVAPREGHLKAMLRLFGYLKHYRKWRLIVDPTPPVRDETKVTDHSWTDLYPDAEEELPPNMPEPKGKTVQITVYKDADGGSDLVTRRSVTGILILANSFPVKFYSKRQATVETSTYGSELVAARIAVDLLVEMRYKLRMLGAPIETPSVMYGDNMSVVLSTTFPSSTLKKKHQAMAWHRVREACAAGIVSFTFVPSVENIADCLTKALSPKVYANLVKPYFTKGSGRTQGECQDGVKPEGAAPPGVGAAASNG